MNTQINPERYVVGTKVRLPIRYGANRERYPAIDTEITKAAWKNTSGIWVCRVAAFSNHTVRVDALKLIND